MGNKESVGQICRKENFMQSCERKMQQMKQDCCAYGMCLDKMQALEKEVLKKGNTSRLRKEKERLESCRRRTEELLDEVEKNCGVGMRHLLLRVFTGKEKLEEIAAELEMDESTLEMTIDSCLFEVVVDHLRMKGEKTYA